jgi:hypothetical protein
MLYRTIRSRNLVALVLVMILTVSLTGSAIANPDIFQIAISDVRSNSFVVSWTTDIASDGSVTWGTSIPPGTVVADGVSSTTTHYVKISGLSPNQTYNFQVSSGGDVDNNVGAYYQVTTGPSLMAIPGTILYGTVTQIDGITVVPNAIVYLQLQDNNGTGNGLSQLVSARADSNGVWSYNLADVRTSDFSSYYLFTAGVDNLCIIGQGGINGTVGLDPTPWCIPIPATGPYQLNVILSQAPTAVTLASFSQGSLTNGVQLNWSTASEVGLLGFNLYRSDELAGVKQKLNANLIPALTPGDLLGNTYQFTDGAAVSGSTYTYWIELVMLDGVQLSDPVTLLVPYWISLPMITR